MHPHIPTTLITAKHEEKTYLLHELTASTNKHASEMLRLPIREEGLKGSALAAKDARRSYGVQDDVALDGGLLAVDLEAADGGDDLVGVLVALVRQKPAGTLRKPYHSRRNNDAEDDLESDREPPY